MISWFNGLSVLSQTFVAIAVPATVVMLLQSLLLLLGFGFGHDANFDFHGDHDAHFDVHGGHDATDGDSGLTLITVRGIVAFFTIGGWTGLVADTAGLPMAASVLIAVAAGTAALFLVALMFKYSMKLQQTGNLDIANAVLQSASVYIPIPEKRSGYGKISVLVQERLVELQAVTDCEHTLKTGEQVVVTAIIDSQTVLVEAAGEQNKSNQNIGGISKWVQH